MSQQIVLLHTLKANIDPGEYERWVREVDYPATRRQPGVIAYEVTRLSQPADGAEPVPYQYLETIRVEDPVAYQRNLVDSSDEGFKAMIAEWAAFVETYTGSVGDLVD